MEPVAPERSPPVLGEGESSWRAKGGQGGARIAAAAAAAGLALNT